MILHVDMDAFYASVEEREQPHLAGKPLIVGGTPDGRGVVCAANYAAREFGVHSAMPTATAIRKCPDATIIPPRMDFYADVSRQIREIFHRYTPVVEPLSLDEAFLDVNGSTKLFGTVENIGRQIKAEIKSELSLVASVGVAPNKFLAKLASDLQKPNGFTIIEPEKVQSTLDPLPVQRIWGIGKVTTQRMAKIGIRTIADLRRLSREELQNQFGAAGLKFWNLARGIDDREVEADRRAKSVSHETTFASDVEDIDELSAWLLELTELVAARLRRKGIVGGTIHLKIRYHDFDTYTRSRSLPSATNKTDLLWATAKHLLFSELPERPLKVRLIGMGVSNLRTGQHQQLELFADDHHEDNSRPSRLDELTDEIRQRFGSAALRRASTVEHNAKHRAQPRPE